MLKERSNTYRQHIRQPELDAESHVTTCGFGNFKIMLYFAIQEDSKIIESHETYFIEKLKPAHNKKHK